MNPASHSPGPAQRLHDLLQISLACFALTFPALASASEPVVTTLPATALTNTSAILNATITPGGAQTTAWFEWDYPAAAIYRQHTTPQYVGNGSNPVTLTENLNNLRLGLAYHCRVVASNSFGIARGRDLGFRSMTLALNGLNPMLIPACLPFSDPGVTPTAPPTLIAAGSEHCLALKADGTLLGWGRNLFGVVNCPVLPNILALAAGSEHNLALLTNGTIAAWGDSSYGKTTIPSLAQSAVAVAAGGDFSLALRPDGRVVAWGDNLWGQISVPAAAQSGVVAISAGAWHSLALKLDGTVIAWGAGKTVGPYHEYGQSIVPADATNVVQVAAGAQNSIILRADGSVLVWGQSCCGITTVPPDATNMVGIAISANSTYCLALRADGKLFGWGSGCCGQTDTPATATNVVAIAPGGFHTVISKEDGTLLGWGDTGFTELPIPAGLDSNNLATATSGSVDTSTLGLYNLTYTVTSASGSTAITNRAVQVVRPQASLPLIVTPIYSNGGFHVIFTNSPCATFTVLSTTNLTDNNPASWSVLGPPTEFAPGQFRFTDPSITSQPHRFYRVLANP